MAHVPRSGSGSTVLYPDQDKAVTENEYLLPFVVIHAKKKKKRNIFQLREAVVQSLI